MPLSNPNKNQVEESEPDHVEPVEIVEPMQMDDDISDKHEHAEDKHDKKKLKILRNILMKK